MAYLDRIAACNRHDLSRFVPFVVAGQRAGWIRRDRRERLAARGDLFAWRSDGVHLNDDLATFAERSEALDGFVRAIAAAGDIAPPRSELFAVARHPGATPLLQIDRAAIAWFGIRALGVHMNGYVRERGALRVWVARRARDKPNAPGKLDQLVAGGQPIGIGLRDNLLKECAEEAGIDAALGVGIRAVGAVTYCVENQVGLKPDTLLCYDLELPADFTPRNHDGEVDSFELWPAERVAATVRDTDDFKLNCNLVAIDFLIRHGVLDESDPDYLSIVAGLRARLP
jgi:8-oxo-dGTP pyrophosphatase MutT (NUDIX family)